jgi:outer membrane lipoprotein-sorting protein
VAALAAGGAATVAVSQISDGGKPTVQEIIRQSQDAYAALTSYSDEGETISSIGTNPVAPHTFTIKLARPNLYRVEWKQDMGFLVQHGAAWSAGEGDFVELSDGKRAKHANGEDALSTAAGVSGGASTSVPSMFFQLSGSKLNGAMQLGKRKSDEKIDGVDCYVLTQSASGRTQTLWIGKQDFLIHRVENVISAPNMKASLAEAGRRNPQIRIPPTTVSGDARLVQTHSKIVVNQKFLPSDFAR